MHDVIALSIIIIIIRLVIIWSLIRSLRETIVEKDALRETLTVEIQIVRLINQLNRLMSFCQSTSSALNIELARKEIILQKSVDVFSAMMGSRAWMNSLRSSAANKKLFKRHSGLPACQINRKIAITLTI